MKKYNSIDGRIHTNSRLWYFIRMAVRRAKNAEKDLRKSVQRQNRDRLHVKQRDGVHPA